MPGNEATVSPTAEPSERASTSTVVNTWSFSQERTASGVARTDIRAARGCQPSDASTPSMGAANATSCQRPETSAAASATATQRNSVRVNSDVRQRSSTSTCRVVFTTFVVTKSRLSLSLRPRHRQAFEQLVDDVGAVHAADPHLRPQGDPVP